MAQIKAAKHQDVSNGIGSSGDGDGRRRRRPRTRSPHAYEPEPGSLIQYRNYILLRLLTILNAAGGSEGLTTSELLREIRSKADRVNDVIAAAERLHYIERKEVESEHGHFPPVYNVITPKGKKLLENLSTK